MRTILWILFLVLALPSRADYLVTSRSATIKAEPASDADKVDHVDENATLVLLDNGVQSNGYYKVVGPAGAEGWIYRTLVRRFAGDPPETTADTSSGSTAEEAPVAANETLEKTYMPKAEASDQLVEHRGFISCMNTEFNVPKWVYHKVSYSLLQGSGLERESAYSKDPEYPSLKTNAYASSGYDHGHLAPAADFKRDEEVYAESFLMTNMSPQHGCFNQKGWCMLESNVRKWAFDTPGSEFYIFSGSILDNSEDALCLPDGTTVTVPDSFFKVVAERRKGKFVRGIAFVIPNGDINGTEVEATKTTIDDVERITGLNFFSVLSTADEKAVEKKVANYPIEDLAECPKRNTPCSKVYAGRTTPDKRTKLVCEN